MYIFPIQSLLPKVMKLFKAWTLLMIKCIHDQLFVYVLSYKHITHKLFQ